MEFYKDLLEKENATIEEIQAACSSGIPDELRAVYWKILLQYLPANKSYRADALDKGRKQYQLFIQEVTTQPEPIDTVPKSVDTKQTEEPRSYPLPRSNRSSAVTTDDDSESTLSKYKTLLDMSISTAAASAENPESNLLFKSEPTLFASHHMVPRKSSVSVFDDSSASTDFPATATPRAAATTPTATHLLSGAGSVAEKQLPRTDVADDPLTVLVGSKGKWAEWHKDEELRGEIEKDIQRTLPGLHFFTVPAHLAAMSRILFVYAKLNAGVRYVQGMNELLAPIWYVMARENGFDTDLEAAEADTFFCFMGLMAEVRDVFIKAHDNSVTGVRGMLTRFGNILRSREPHVSAYLASMHLDNQFYAFRWVTTLLSREFHMPDVLMLWDCFFADAQRFDFLLYTCVAMMRMQRSTILASDFGGCMKLLQNYPDVDVCKLLSIAAQIRWEEEEEARGGVVVAPDIAPVEPATGGRSMSFRFSGKFSAPKILQEAFGAIAQAAKTPVASPPSLSRSSSGRSPVIDPLTGTIIS